MKWQEEKSLLLLGYSWPLEDSEAKGSDVGGEGDLHEVPAGTSGDPEAEEEDTSGTKAQGQNRPLHQQTHMFLYVCKD